MRKYGMNVRFLIMLLTVALFTSCSKESNYMQSIPADATIVITADCKAIAEKADFKELFKNPEISSLLASFQKSLGDDASKMLDTVLKDPEQSGISFDNSFVLFSNAVDGEVGMLLKLKDRNKFNELLQIMQKEGVSSEISDAKGFKYCILGEKAFCAFSSDRILILESAFNRESPEKIKENAGKYIRQEKDKSLLVDKGFERFIKNQKEINYWFSMASTPPQVSTIYSSFMPDKFKLGTVYAMANLSFEKGKIVITNESYSTDAETQKILENFSELCGKLTGKFLKAIPADAWLTYDININGKKLLEYLSQKQEIKKLFENKEFDFKGMIESIDGDITLSLIDLPGDNSFVKTPNMALFAEVNNDILITELSKFGQILGMVPLGKNQYALNMNGLGLYFGMAGNDRFFITTDESIIDSINKGAIESLADSPAAKVFKNTNGAMYINMISISKGLPVNLLTKEIGVGSNETESLKKILSLSTSIESRQQESLKGVTTIYMQNQTENALTSIMKAFN
ncbi:DUF4836 family protein [Coprobacter tertius]|uniref:DUF4836 family protein n=1 Tax=Coprobacter tertius TaxID=2944915 RepID=A0ABT1MHY8_9BACT|nr:DUF4836 family protein [Coprobacter tertius]MCP9611471.1 DUF4836 family protein [Coprobacter tertius]